MEADGNVLKVDSIGLADGLDMEVIVNCQG